MTLLALVLAFAGLSALALTSQRHLRQLAPQPPTAARRRAVRAFGWAVLAASLPPAIDAYGTSIGIAIWLGLLSVAVLAVGLLLTYRPRWLVALGPVRLLSPPRARHPASGDPYR